MTSDKFSIRLVYFLTFVFSVPIAIYSQEKNDSASFFRDLASFQNPGKEWGEAADVLVTPGLSGSFRKTSGTGIIVTNAVKGETELITSAKFGDIDLEFDFLLSKGAKSAIILQGRYLLNLSDSWAANEGSYNSMGGIGKQNQMDSSGFSGAAPFVNAAKAPGLWQHVRIRFRAPHFAGNTKTSNALLEETYINECLVQQNTELQGPASGTQSTAEQAEGPVVFHVGNGVFALRNMVARKLSPFVEQRAMVRQVRVTNPITITPERGNFLLRGFLNYKNKKRTHVISVGNPREVNYSYDLKQGALLQVWGGPFLDVTEMWEQRGEPQLAKPLGSVVTLSETPALAVLPDQNGAWPDSIAFDDFKNLGYTLDKARNPAFEYETGGFHVWDKISILTEGRGLSRQLTVTRAPSNLYCRLAVSSAITSQGKGLFLVGDKSYFIQIDESLKPLLRKASAGVELLVPVSANRPVTYSLIW